MHFGPSNSVWFLPPNADPGEAVIHLQCLSGVHFNPASAKRGYEPPHLPQSSELRKMSEDGQVSESDTQSSDEAEVCCEKEQEICSMKSSPERCIVHPRSHQASVTVTIDDNPVCMIMDTGAEVNCASLSVVQRCRGTICHCQVSTIGGLGSTPTKTHGCSTMPIFIDGMDRPKLVNLVVVDDRVFPACLLVGIGFLRDVNLSINYRDASYRIDDGRPYMLPRTSPDADCCLPSALSIERLFSKATVEVCVGTPGSSLSLRLSRDEEGNVVGFSSALSSHEIRAIQTDSVISKVITLVLSTAEIWPNELADFRRYRNQLRLDNGILYYDRGTFNAYVVTFTLLVEVLLMIHHKLNHIGRQKLVELTSQHVWHPEMQNVAGDVCTSCHVCQTMKIMPTVTPPMMKIRTTRPFELVAVDLVLLPRSQQFIGCLVAIDHTTKWLMVHPIRNKSATHIAKIFEHKILPSCIKLPEKILSDNGGEFKSSLFQEVLERYNIKHIFTTANKPSSYGLVERVNRTLIEQLRIGQEDGGNSWVDRLAKVVRVYNGTYQTAIHCSPSQFILCKSHQSRDDLHLPAGAPETWSEGSSFFQTYDVGQEVLKKVILRGNEVLGKFQPRFEGPFTIIHANENGVTYQVEDGASGRILKVHHSQLRRYVRAPEYLLGNPYHRLLSSGKPVSHYGEDEVTPVALVAAMKMQSESESSTDESLEQASTSSEGDQQDSTNQPILDSEDETETEVRNVRRSLATSSENWSRMATGGFSAARLLHLLGEESSEGEVECSCGQCESPLRKSKSTPVEELEEPVMLPVTPPDRNDVHTEEKEYDGTCIEFEQRSFIGLRRGSYGSFSGLR